MPPAGIDEAAVRRNAEHCRSRGILLPTLAQLRDPSLVPESVRVRLRSVDIDATDPLNLWRLGWKNKRSTDSGSGCEPCEPYGDVNHFIVPSELTGCGAKVVILAGGKNFPTGAHKVGATFCILADKLTSGELDPSKHRLLWPSTGNYCRGGVFDCELLQCEAIAVLPEDMSQERFDWLRAHGATVVRTPGGESNVKEIFDEVRELSRADESIMVCNQFAEFGNPLWHYAVTGPAMGQVFASLRAAHGNGGGDGSVVDGNKSAGRSGPQLRGVFSCTGSAGTIACGDYVKSVYPRAKVAAGEALQCPTLTAAGHGSHRIEGIGDKIVPWVHNVRNLDAAVALDDDHVLRVFRLFNTDAGRAVLKRGGVPDDALAWLPSLGISSIANLIGSVKLCRSQEWSRPTDVVFTIATDTAAMYQSRLAEMAEKFGDYTEADALADWKQCLLGASTDHVHELTHADRKRIHGLKYFTWVEQQGMDPEELDRMWDDHEEYWGRVWDRAADIDERIKAFNAIIAKE